jgi:phytoene/squalene synthetase
MERWRVRLVRVSYLYFRYLDDVADGDRACPTGPKPLLDQQLSRWRAGSFESDSTHEVNVLFGYLWNEFKERTFPLSRVRFLGLSIITGLQLDLERRVERRVLRRAELGDYYTKVILAPAQLGHTILNARVTHPALQEISIVIGRLQSARDLESDWMRGLINIPWEDLGNPDYAAQVTLPQEIEIWRAHEIDRCSIRLRDIWQRWPWVADDRSRALMKPAVETLLNWASKQPRGYQTF